MERTLPQRNHWQCTAITVLALAALCTLASSCSDSTAPPSPPAVDPALVGDWIRVENDDLSERPTYRGFRFERNGTVRHLGVATSTGVLRLNDERRYYDLTVLEARDGMMRLQLTTFGWGARTVEYDLTYDLTDMYVTFASESPEVLFYLGGSFRASAVGRQVAEPIRSHLDIRMTGGSFGDVTFVSPDVWAGPSAWADKWVTSHGDRLRIRGTIDLHRSVLLEILDFAGPGEYVFGDPTAHTLQYVEVEGDVIGGMNPDFESPVGRIIIESAGGRFFTGRFEATLYERSCCEDPVPVTVSGRFEVPYYGE